MKKLLSALFMVTISLPTLARECTIVELGEVDGNRIHIKCAETFPDGSDNIRYFAYPTNNSSENERDRANRIWSAALTAVSTGRPLHLDFWNGDSHGATYGCGSHDCRHIRHFRLYP